MPRVPQISERGDVPEDMARHFDAIASSRGRVSGPFSVLLNSPEIAGRAAHLGAYIRFESVIPPDLRELAILCAAREFNCDYEWAAHVVIARNEGTREDAIRAVSERLAADGLTDDEAAVITYAREMFGADKRVSDAAFARVERRFGAQGVTELTATMGYYAMLACALNAFEVEPPPDAERLA